MNNLTILNCCIHPIKIFLYYNLKENSIQYTQISAFLANSDIKTFTLPDNYLNVIVSILIKLENNSLKEIYSTKLNISTKKYYQFIGSNNYSILQELNAIQILNYHKSIFNKAITIKNSLDFPIKCNFSFYFEKILNNLEDKNCFINKKEKKSFSIPFYCYEINFTIFFKDLNSNSTFTIAKNIVLKNNNLPKCYEIFRNPINYSIDIFQDICINE